MKLIHVLAVAVLSLGLAACQKPTKPDTTAQQIGAALTYLRRQSIQAAMGIATDLDDDGNSISHQPAEAPKSWKGAGRA